MNTIHIAVGQELPGVAIDWLDTGDVVAALGTGWTGTLKLAHSDRPRTVLHTVTGITLADTSPNFVLAEWPSTAISTLVAAWGRTPSVRGSLFYAWPHLVRTAGSADRPWPDGADPISLWVYPAVT